MSKKFGFISHIVEDSISPKIKYQVFEAELGFEHAEVLIPFDKADDFVKESESLAPKSLTALSKIAAKFGGSIK
jgi:hypothetical protein